MSYRVSLANLPFRMPLRVPAGQIERNRTGRTGWLRAAVLGANDGILSTSSLILGVAAAHGSHGSILVGGRGSGCRGDVDGRGRIRVSAIPGRYRAGRTRARATELKTDHKNEQRELAAIYVARGLDSALAKQVAEQLMDHDALDAHARDELGISEIMRARPIQAALTSAGSFTVGAAMPLLVTVMAPAKSLTVLVGGTALIFLALLGGLAAHVGGAAVTIGAARVTFWGAMAMAVTAGVGALFGAVT